MALSWDSVCIKYLMFIFNLAFVITGIIILSVGSAIKAYYHEYEIFLADSYFSTSNLLIAIGSLIFIIAFFGCCGAIKENFCMTITFSTLLVLIFVLELAAGISGYVLRNNTTEYLSESLKNTMAHYKDNNDTAAAWDQIQTKFNCCGVKGPADWDALNNQTSIYPISCCSAPTGVFGQFVCDKNTTEPFLHKTGCLTAFGEYVEDHAYTLGGIGLGFAIIQALGIVFSCRLSRQIRLNYENV